MFSPAANDDAIRIGKLTRLLGSLSDLRNGDKVNKALRASVVAEINYRRLSMGTALRQAAEDEARRFPAIPAKG